PKLDANLRNLVGAELAAARTDVARLSRRPEAHRSRSGRPLTGLGALAVIAIVAALAIRGTTTGGSSAGAPGTSGSVASSDAVAITSPTPTSTGTPTLRPSLSPPPASGSFTPTGSMTTSDGGTATLLADGRVLIVGNGATSPELYDPATGKFSSTGEAAKDGNFGTATRLADGRVLFVGGNNNTTTFASAALYDPTTGKFSPTGSLIAGRMGHTATLLADGRVLIAGGSTFNYAAMPMAVEMAYHPGAAGASSIQKTMTGPAMLATAELYDPATGKFSATGSMTVGRANHTATLLADGRVLMAGGGNEGSAAGASAELYDPKTGKFSRTGSMLVAQYGQNATLLPDGRVLISAGNDGTGPVYSLETYDPKTGKFSAAGSMDTTHGFYAATLLADGRVLFVGGYDTSAPKDSGYLATCELFDPATSKLSPTGSMNTGHLAGSVTRLLDGRVLVAGGVGVGDPGNLSSAELYQP
ncbi:MAG TPA: kelch repeat-containing protein, partial [Candidatus Limnocylindrales bacterium]